MRKLPQTDDLPHAAEGYEPARVDEAFAAFAERVRELESVASELRAELRSLRAQRAAPTSLAPEAWPDAGLAPSPDWVAAVPAPFSRRPAVPRLAVEGAFLLLVALLAGIADLSAAWIVLVMAVAWALVALAEWAAAAKRARWRLDEVAPAHEAADASSESTGPWDAPVVEATVIDDPRSESKTIVTKLPVDQGELGAEAAPPVRRRGLRRRRSGEATAAD
ncbi:MAG: hypothetical protein QOJ43_2114 [Gaiellaceae bacterium]|nr:hypothetical protein [Gaiellaceae bacterium]